MSMYLKDSPPRSPHETLPTMYDLPSEAIGEPGLPDEFHGIQALFLKETFRPPCIPPDEVFSAMDLNLYYDVRYPLRYKRPDWFGVVGVPRLYDGQVMRNSYVVWQEGVSPLVIVEFLSPGTQKEDLGQILRDVEGVPTKWEVYERFLRVPYYVALNGDTGELHFFQLSGDRYQAISPEGKKLWIPSIELGLGLWQGSYDGKQRLWLRWFDKEGAWIPTSDEQAAQAKAEAAQAKAEKEAALQQLEKLAAKLKELGIDPEHI